MEFDRVKKKLDALKHGLASHADLKRRGSERGFESEPLKSHEGLDIVELEVYNSMKDLHRETILTYENAIAHERKKTHSNLIKVESNSLDNADLNHDLPKEDSHSIFSDSMEKYRSDLTETGSKAIDSLKNITKFKEKNHLDREAEYPDNRTNFFLIIAGVIFVVGLFMFGLLSPQESDSSIIGILGTVLLILAFNTVSGIISSECIRAFRHQVDALRITSKIIFFVLGVLAIVFNLGIGHYRDALDPDYPTIAISETTNIENSEIDTESNITQNPTENDDISAESSSASEQAIALLFRKILFLNELHSYILTILGIILLLATIWLAWNNDDEYFRYGEKTRQYKRSITQWNSAHEKIRNALKIQYNRMHENLQASRINFVDQRAVILQNYDNFSTEADQLIQQIKETCELSICVYRTANKEVRPKLTPAPHHWDENWKPNWDKFIPSNPDYLCSQEEAFTITEHRNQEINDRITDLEETYQSFLNQVSRFGPRIEKST